MAIELCSRENCTGCMACVQKCPYNSIKIVEESGFYYPKIIRETCKECMVCMNTCPTINNKAYSGNTFIETSECLAAWSMDLQTRQHSSSGGLFAELSKAILQQKGIVYGAAWDEQLVLRHSKASTLDELIPLMRSKYVQSDVSKTYVQVKQDLDKNIIVMFVGTPCQVAGLMSFLNHKDYHNLLLVDILCQGVPSPILFKKYIDEFERKNKKKVIDVIFRSKDAGWRCGLLLLLKCDDGSTYTCKYGNNAFYRAFITEHNMRPSCYNCQFKPDGQGYYGDILLADFWRIGTSVPFNVNGWQDGVSAVLCETEKGCEYVSKISDNLNINNRTFEEFSSNGGLRKAHKPQNYEISLTEAFFQTSEENQKKYYPFTWKNYLSHFLQLNTNEITVRKIKKMIGK